MAKSPWTRSDLWITQTPPYKPSQFPVLWSHCYSLHTLFNQYILTICSAEHLNTCFLKGKREKSWNKYHREHDGFNLNNLKLKLQLETPTDTSRYTTGELTGSKELLPHDIHKEIQIRRWQSFEHSSQHIKNIPNKQTQVQGLIHHYMSCRFESPPFTRNIDLSDILGYRRFVGKRCYVKKTTCKSVFFPVDVRSSPSLFVCILFKGIVLYCLLCCVLFFFVVVVCLFVLKQICIGTSAL